MIKNGEGKSSGHCDVLIVQRAPVTYYPPVINQVNMLAEAGLAVVIIDGAESKESVPNFMLGVTLLRPLGDEKHRLLSDNFRFSSFVRTMLKACKRTSVCIAYDDPAALLLSIIPFSGHKIFHFHEYPLGNDNNKLNVVLRSKVTEMFMGKSAHIVMADSHRSSSFFKERTLSQRPEALRNCPRKISKLPEGILRKKLVSMGMAKNHIIIFQGSVSLNLYADHIVKSMQFWPCDSVMVFIGPVRSDIEKLLTQIAIETGVSERLCFLGQVPYSELFSYTVDADVAFTMIKPVSFNYMHMAGASNKRYDAMACGVPQISNFGPGMHELIMDNGIGVCVDAESPEEIGRNVAGLLADSEIRMEMSNKARNLHLTKLNYDAEFSNLRDRIVKTCRGEN